ncbi:MAG TPA: class I SAM-dependent methyltransferase [Clostridia bacterium]|nr:class I SAM-dependent methyltransferase [Clostridia bacterium]
MAQAESVSAEWDSTAYDVLAKPEVEWGKKVLDRLHLQGFEKVLDAGCGTGRVTAMLCERLPHGHVIAVDLSDNMLNVAREHLKGVSGRVKFVQADLVNLSLQEEVDGIFSTAAIHWISDHWKLFGGFYRALRPGGWLVAQCGAAPNLARLRRRAAELVYEGMFSVYFRDWTDPWMFVEHTTMAERLRLVGFENVKTTQVPAYSCMPNREMYKQYISTVTLRKHVAQMPAEIAQKFLNVLADMAEHDTPKFEMDYWRLNMSAVKPANTAAVNSNLASTSN